MTNKMQGYLSLLLVVAMMFVVVFGVARIDNTTEQAPAATDKGTGTETAIIQCHQESGEGCSCKCRFEY